MARAFVLTGGSRSQLGLLENARALGYEVCVVDGSESAPLLAEADYRIVRSFTEVDRVLADLEAQGIEPVAVATMGSDQAVLPTAKLAERLGLPGLAAGDGQDGRGQAAHAEGLREGERALPARPRGEHLRRGRAGLP